MAGSFVVNGDNTITVAFSYTGQTDIVQTTADAAAHGLYNAGQVPVTVSGVGIPWEELTNQNKLNLLDKFILSHLHELAIGYLHNVRQEAARAYREEDVATIL